MNQQRTNPQKENLTHYAAVSPGKKTKLTEAYRAPDNSKPIKNLPQKGHEKNILYGNITGKIYNGTVRVFANDLGYGFIYDNSTKTSYFISRSSLLEAVNSKDEVSFELEHTPTGNIAFNVRKHH